MGKGFQTQFGTQRHYHSPMPERAGRAAIRLPAGLEFVRVLGQGGNGVVCLARQAGVGRPVAVKLVLAGNADPAERLRLAREGQALARLQHPSIARVYELVPVGDDLALVLEYVDGPDLATLLRAAHPSVATRLAILVSVADALEHAASVGIVHRDVKPSNVLVPHGGAAKLADFGIARLTASAAAFRTTDGTARGTAPYLAPETLTNPATASPAADVYSFTVMAYQLLTGVTPFSGTAEQLAAAHRALSPPAACDVVPGFPVAASDALATGLAKSPHQRPTPGALVARLRALPASAWAATDAALLRGRPTSLPAGQPATRAATEPAAAATTAASAPPREANAAPSTAPPPLLAGDTEDPGWVEPSRVPLPGPSRRRVPAWLVGLCVGVALAAAVLLVAARR